MYIQRINTKQNGKVYPSIVLCHSYRENGKQKRKILATLTKWPKHIVEGLEKIIKGASVFSLADLEHRQGKSVGAIWVLFQLAKQIGLDKALGTGKQAKLALLQILTNVKLFYCKSAIYISFEMVHFCTSIYSILS